MRAVDTGAGDDESWSFPPNEAKALAVVWLALHFTAAAIFFGLDGPDARPWVLPAFLVALGMVVAGRTLIGRAQRRRGRSFGSGSSWSDGEAARAAMQSLGWNGAVVLALRVLGWTAFAAGALHAARSLWQG